jgi:hypothetical protein
MFEFNKVENLNHGLIKHPVSTGSAEQAALLPNGSPPLSSRLFPLADLHFSRSFAGPSVCVSALAMNRQTATVTQTAIATEVHEPLNVHGYLAAKVSFDLVRAVKHLTNLCYVHLSKLIRVHVRIEPAFFDDLAGGGSSDAVDVRQRYFHALILGKVNPCDTRHDLPPGDKANVNRD